MHIFTLLWDNAVCHIKLTLPSMPGLNSMFIPSLETTHRARGVGTHFSPTRRRFHISAKRYRKAKLQNLIRIRSLRCSKLNFVPNICVLWVLIIKMRTLLVSSPVTSKGHIRVCMQVTCLFYGDYTIGTLERSYGKPFYHLFNISRYLEVFQDFSKSFFRYIEIISDIYFKISKKIFRYLEKILDILKRFLDI